MRAGEYASERILEIESKSKLKKRDVPKFELSDIDVGKVIGKGGFGCVYKVALKDHDVGDSVIKYEHDIGKVVEPI